MFSFESIGAALIPDSDETFETLARGQLTSHGETKILNFDDSYDPSGDADLRPGGTPRLKIYSSIENLLNEDYAAAYGFPSLPFTIRGGVAMRIGGDQ